MRTLTAALGAATLGLCLSACSGYDGPAGGNSGNPTAPSGAIVINVVAENGAQSFSPNPATIPAGQTVVWRNVDTIVHRVVLDDRSIDTGNIAAGASSAAMTLGSVGGYHCSIHPSMVGTLTR